MNRTYIRRYRRNTRPTEGQAIDRRGRIVKCHDMDEAARHGLVFAPEGSVAGAMCKTGRLFTPEGHRKLRQMFVRAREGWGQY